MKSVPPSARAMAPGGVLDRAGEGAAPPAEELGHLQLLGHARADRASRRAARCARDCSWHQRARRDLPTPVGPAEEDGLVLLGEDAEQLDELGHRRADDGEELVGAARGGGRARRERRRGTAPRGRRGAARRVAARGPDERLADGRPGSAPRARPCRRRRRPAARSGTTWTCVASRSSRRSRVSSPGEPAGRARPSRALGRARRSGSQGRTVPSCTSMETGSGAPRPSASRRRGEVAGALDARAAGVLDAEEALVAVAGPQVHHRRGAAARGPARRSRRAPSRRARAWPRARRALHVSAARAPAHAERVAAGR